MTIKGNNGESLRRDKEQVFVHVTLISKIIFEGVKMLTLRGSASVTEARQSNFKQNKKVKKKPFMSK